MWKESRLAQEYLCAYARNLVLSWSKTGPGFLTEDYLFVCCPVSRGCTDVANGRLLVVSSGGPVRLMLSGPLDESSKTHCGGQICRVGLPLMPLHVLSLPQLECRLSAFFPQHDCPHTDAGETLLH